MPCHDRLAISGWIRVESGRPLQGAALEVIGESSGALIAETASGEDGFFRVEIETGALPLSERKERGFSLRVRDGRGRTIGRRRHLDWSPGEELGVSVEIDPDDFEGFTPVALPLERFEGPLAGADVRKPLARAVSMLHEPGTSSYNRFLNAALCPLPPLFDHDNLMDAASGVLDGDPYAGLELTQILEPYARRDVSFETRLDRLVIEEAGTDIDARRTDTGGDPEGAPEDPTPPPANRPLALSAAGGPTGYTPHPGRPDLGVPCLIPPERFRTLTVATLLAARSPGHAAHMMRGLEIGLCGLGRSSVLFGAAHMAVRTGDPAHLHGLLRRSMHECGPDDGPPRDPFPRPDPDGCDPPFGDLPDRCGPPVECLHDFARGLHGVFGRSAPYRIDALDPEDACPGSELTITGTNFGTHGGNVCFSFSATTGRLPGMTGTCVAADSWSDTEIVVTVPEDAPSGGVSLRIVEGSDRICGDLVTIYRKGNSLPFAGGSTAVRVTLDRFRCMAPGETLGISWDANPDDASVDISLLEEGSTLQSWNDRPSDGTVEWTAPDADRTRTLTVTATAEGACGTATDSETVAVDVAPRLTITGMEVTQGIQTYGRTDGTPDNSLPTVGGKDTIVRVYVDCDRDGFLGNTLDDVTGTLRVGGTTLSPINGQTPFDCGSWSGGDPFITARAASAVDRTQTDHTLNFRIPAALSVGTRRLRATVVGPSVCGEEPRDDRTMSWTWRSETPLRVRYVRIRNDHSGTGAPDRPSDAEARCTIDRGFDMLPTPATDVAPARVGTLNTNRNFTTNAGLQNLLADLDDEHNCSAWEWLTQPFGSDCPDPDDAYWVGLTGPFNRGWAYRPGNTCMSARYGPPGQGQAAIVRIKTAHELGHNLGLRHVNQACGTATVNGPFDTLPNGGTLLDVPFDPYWNTAVGGAIGDFMTYACTRWTSGDAWGRLRSAI